MDETARPDYVIRSYSDEIYKVIRYKKNHSDEWSLLKIDKTLQQSNETKLDNNLCRARTMVLQYALCNPWTWFFTGTLDKTKYDRLDLPKYKTDLMQFVRDQRKKHGCALKVLLVPEAHKDGAWHMHGFISDLPETALTPFEFGKHPIELVRGHFLNWRDYAKKFGFCSLAQIREPVGASLYLTKYISKDVAQRSGDLGGHLYIPSRGLKKAELVAEAYGGQPTLDSLLEYHGRFCSTGMVFEKDASFPVSDDEWHYLGDAVDVPESNLWFPSATSVVPDDADPWKATQSPYVRLRPEPGFRPEQLEPSWEQFSLY